MCGIVGFTGSIESTLLKRMTDALRHRGPDGEGFYMDERTKVNLGHRRLSILDIETGGQPMVTADGTYTVIFNGEIYNYKELRQELAEKGYHFASHHSDTEVLLHGYKEWGVQLAQKLNGMWAFCIYDKNKEQLFISRDRFGKKPFYYSFQQGQFVFASELRAVLLHPAVSKIFSTIGLHKYFAYGYVPAPYSMIDHVYKLPAGCNMLVDIKTNTPHISRYWQFEYTPLVAFNEAPLCKDLRIILYNAVERRLAADVPVGVFLSGGVDSSVVAALATQAIGKHRVDSFSIGFKEKDYDESLFAEKVAKQLGVKHHIEMLSVDEASALIPEIMNMLDEPMADSSILPTYLLCRETHKHVKVALGGDGGDELFYGYNPFKQFRFVKQYQQWIPEFLSPAIVKLASLLPTKHGNITFDYKLKNTLRAAYQPAEAWVPLWLAPLSMQQLQTLFNSEEQAAYFYKDAIETAHSSVLPDEVSQAYQFYVNMYLQDDILTKVDRASMVHSLEVRAPFLDIEVADFARRLPAPLKLNRNEGKYLLKKAFEGILPNEILYRSKQGFGVPIGKWFKEGVIDITIDNEIPVNTDFVKQLITEHKSGKADHKTFLWAYKVLVDWKKSIDN